MSTDSGQVAIGEYLRLRRVEKQLTVAALAARTGLSPNAIRWIERGVTQPKPESLKALAGPLELGYEALLLRAGYLEQAGLSEEDRELLTLLRSLSPLARSALREILGLLQRSAQPETPQ